MKIAHLMGENHLPREKPHPEDEKQRRAASPEDEEDAASSLTSITLMNENLHNRRGAAPDEERRPPKDRACSAACNQDTLMREKYIFRTEFSSSRISEGRVNGVYNSKFSILMT